MITDMNEIKWQKKPVIIKARQMTVETIEDVEAWCGGCIKGIKLPREEWIIHIETLEGEMRADMNDWIIKGIRGEFYPCKPDIFMETYDKVSPAYVSDNPNGD